MKRVGNLYEDLCSFENLYLAYKKAAKSVKFKPETLRYFYYLEYNLRHLQLKLLGEEYFPGVYRQFTIKDPKLRVISVASFEDRVVHHALINILEPIYERSFIHDSYATRKNKGTHKAVHRAQQFIRKNRYYLKMDVRKYFDSVDQAILLNIISSKIKDKKLFNLVSRIIKNGGENGKGLPIGNLTSQFFANCYLDRFDHIVKDYYAEKYYIRYMDDILLFSDDKEHLKDLRAFCRYTLKKELKLDLKEKVVFINSRENGVSFLGTRVFPDLIRINNKNLKRSLRRLKESEYKYREDIISEEQFTQSANSIVAHLCQYDTLSLRRAVFGKRP
jgi:retron-type reverse transcriptase